MTVFAALVIGCGNVAPSPTATATATALASPAQNAAPVTVRWFVVVGWVGMSLPKFPFVDEFNASQNRIHIELEEVLNGQADQILQRDIAEGRAPDIVGPFWDGQRYGLTDFLDLAPLVEKHEFDMTQFEPEILRVLQEGGRQIALPYAADPGFLWYNRDLFAKAGLPDLPRHVGETYQGRPWDWRTVADVAGQLTLDYYGRKPGDPAFDPDRIAEWGIDFQWSDALRLAACFGGGSLVGADGRTAGIPDAYRDAWTWYYDAIWKKHIAPTGSVVESRSLNSGSTMSSGRVAMSTAWDWELDSLARYDTTPAFANWDIAVMPSWNGRTSSPVDVQGFSILPSTTHPDEAFEAMLALMADRGIRDYFAGMPAGIAEQKPYLAARDVTLRKTFPGNTVSWSVIQDMSQYAAIPGPYAAIPNATTTGETLRNFYKRLQTTPGLDMDVELAALRTQLQADFDAARETR